MSKPWYKSRTIWFNALAGGFALVVDNISLLRGDLPDWIYLALLFAVNTINILLRSVTTVPVTLGGDDGDR